MSLHRLMRDQRRQRVVRSARIHAEAASTWRELSDVCAS